MCSLFTWFNLQILNFCHRWHGHIQNTLNYLKWSIFENSKWLTVVNCFHKTPHLRCLTGFWIRLWMLSENQVFLQFIIQNQSKTKTIPHTVFETFIKNISRYKTQKLSWWVLWAGEKLSWLEIFAKAFLLKIIIRTWTCLYFLFQFFFNCYKESPKRCDPPKKCKNSSHYKRYKKGIGKQEKMKNEKYKKSLTA